MCWNSLVNNFFRRTQKNQNMHKNSEYLPEHKLCAKPQPFHKNESLIIASLIVSTLLETCRTHKHRTKKLPSTIWLFALCETTHNLINSWQDHLIKSLATTFCARSCFLCPVKYIPQWSGKSPMHIWEIIRTQLFGAVVHCEQNEELGMKSDWI